MKLGVDLFCAYYLSVVVLTTSAIAVEGSLQMIGTNVKDANESSVLLIGLVTSSI